MVGAAAPSSAMNQSMHRPKNTEMGICHRSTSRNSRRRRATCTSTRKHCQPSMNVPKLTAGRPRASTLGVAEMGELPRSAFTTTSMPRAMTAMPASMRAMRPVMNSAGRRLERREPPPCALAQPGVECFGAGPAGRGLCEPIGSPEPDRTDGASGRPEAVRAARGEGLSDGSVAQPERSRPMDFPLVRISLPRLIFRSVIVSSPSFPVSLSLR